MHTTLDRVYDLVSRGLLLFLAALSAFAAILRIVYRAPDDVKNLDETTLLYLGVAGALVLLRDVKTLAFGDYKLEFERVVKIANEAKNTADNAQALAVGTGGERGQHVPASSLEMAQPEVEVDPSKGKFGGQSKRNNRSLEAEVVRVAGIPDLFSVRLVVRPTLPEKDPLREGVQFFLHPTFSNPNPVVSIGPSGVAELNLKAWGAFTVGAVTDNGKTQLELDLSELESAPEDFRRR